MRAYTVPASLGQPPLAGGQLPLAGRLPVARQRARSLQGEWHPARRCSHLGATQSNLAGAPLSRQFDVVALGNLCVDIVLSQTELPPPDLATRRALLERLSGSPTDRATWEVGGSCNFAIAAARLGLNVATIGHLGEDVYGRFLEDVLQDANVRTIEGVLPSVAAGGGSSSPPPSNQTLLCFVLVDPNSQHAFCSRYDFGPWPLLSGVKGLPQPALQLLRQARAVYCNGFVFDELPLEVVRGAALAATAAGAAIFFDPGPRCHTMLSGSRRAALDTMLDLSDVVLMTEEEGYVVTGESDPELAAAAVLARPGSRTQWVVCKLGGKGALLCRRGPPGGKLDVVAANALTVDVTDTVGCGDSFAAAVVLGYIRQHAIPSTLKLANAVGAATAMQRGAGRNVASADRVLRLLQRETGGGAAAADAVLARDAISLLETSLSGARTPAQVA